MKQVSVTEAFTLQQSGSTYVDVRSSAEYAAGHPAGAVNVPLLELDGRTGQMMPNPDFTGVMQANFPPDSKLLLGCQVGGRSARATMILESLGYSDVANVAGGFGGGRDPMTGRPSPGWSQAGLPIETDPPPGKSYADLAAKAGA